tara:strand:+ start:1142 stop:1579 length:438 start_codon:yes stop_codon:yes gene_type:complete
MNYKIQSDKSVKIFIKINVITNINFDYDISLDLNEMNVKKNLNYIFTTKYLDTSSLDISDKIELICKEDNYVNIIYIENEKKKFFNKILNNIKKLHYVSGKKMILVSNVNYFKTNKIKEFIFYIDKKNKNKKQILSKIKEKLILI